MAQRTMGPDGAATVIAFILQRIGEITYPGGYLRALLKKAALGTFSVTAMTFALLKTQGRPYALKLRQQIERIAV